MPSKFYLVRQSSFAKTVFYLKNVNIEENPTTKHNRVERIFLPKKELFYGILRDEVKIPQVKVMLIEDFPTG